jgi:enterochelin esterase-like enzyme
VPALLGQDYERYKTLLDTTVHSKNLGFDKHLTITVPFEWQKDVERNFPLIVVFDRQNQRSHNYILNTIDYLTSNEQMPSCIVVGIESEQNYRYKETLHKASSADGRAQENEKFLFEELIPMMENEFKASQFRVFIGHSRYGYFTTSLFFSRLHDLNAVVSLSPFFTQKNVDLTDSIAGLKGRNCTAQKFYFYGIGNDYPEDFHKMDSAMNTLNHPKIQTEGFLFRQADHNVTPGLTIGPALYAIFEQWSAVQGAYLAEEQKNLQIIRPLEESIATFYGSKLAFSLGILNGKGWYFYNEGQFDKAIEAWEILLRSYPNFAEAYLYILDAQIQLKQDYSGTLTKFNRCLATSQMYSPQEKQELLEELKNLTK